MAVEEENQQNQSQSPNSLEVPIEAENQKYWLFQKILDVYFDVQESLELARNLIAYNELDIFLLDTQIQIEKVDISKRQRKKLENTIEYLRYTHPDDFEVIFKESENLLSNYPDITKFSEFAKFTLALGMGLLNGAKATATKFGITTYLLYEANRSNDSETTAILVALASINTLTYAPPSPSLSRILSYIDYTFFEEIFLRILKKKELREIFTFTKKDFITVPKISMLFEGSGIVSVLPMEVLRMFELDEVSIKTIMFWKRIHQLRRFQKPKTITL